MVNNIKNNTIDKVSAKEGLNTLNEIKNAEIIKYKRCTPGQKELLNLFNDLLDTLLINKTLKPKNQEDNTLMSSKDENVNVNENESENDKRLISSKDQNEKQNELLNNDNNANAKNKKTSTNTKKATNKKKDKNENLLVEYMGNADDKLFKEYSNGKNFNSFINEFDLATNEEDREKVVKELKDTNEIVNRDIFIMNEDSEYRSKLIGIVNVIDYFLDEYSKKWASDFNWEKQSKLLSTLCN